MVVLIHLPLRKPHLSVILPGFGLHEVVAAFFYACLQYLHCADLAGHSFSLLVVSSISATFFASCFR